MAVAANPSNDTHLPSSAVLVVDDNPQNVELMQAYLESLNVTTSVAVDGIDALEKVSQTNPDLILLDVMMPRMSGFEVCRKLKADPKYRDIPIIMVTALNEHGDIERAVQSGTDEFLSKPINKLELLTRVKSLLRVRHMKNELERTLAYLTDVETGNDDTTEYICSTHPDVIRAYQTQCPKCAQPLMPRR